MSIGEWLALASLLLVGLGLLGGVVAWTWVQLAKVRAEALEAVEAKAKELKEDRLRECERLSRLIDEERNERRRELDKMERTISGFADVASAVVAMGKSIEHVAERQTDQQDQYRRDMGEVKTLIRGIETRLMDGNFQKKD